MLNALSPVARFCGISALAVIGSGVLWCCVGEGRARIVPPAPLVVESVPPPPLAPTVPETPTLPETPAPPAANPPAAVLPAADPQPDLPIAESDPAVPVEPDPPAPVAAAPAVAALPDPAAQPDVPAAPAAAPQVDLMRMAEKVQLAPEKQHLAQGRELFLHNWKVKDPLSHGDGLGPVFNARSCAECHAVGGLSGAGDNTHNVCVFLIVPGRGDAVVEGAIHHFSLGNTGESLLQAAALLEHVAPTPANARPHPAPLILVGQLISTGVSTPSLWGAGLIDQIPDDEVRNTSTPYGGSRPRDLGSGHVGKFGWKGQFGSLREFVANACAAELGLGNSVRSQSASNAYGNDLEARHDLTDEQVQALTDFVAQLPVPQQMLPANPQLRQQAERGEQVFYEVGCNHCHRKNVGPAKEVYSDFHLHNVVSETGPIEPYYWKAEKVEWPPEYPKPREWKTPPLWGLADTAPYWHDGSALTVEIAILKHGTTANPVIDAYVALPPSDQEALLAFLGTLRAPANNPNPAPEPVHHKKPARGKAKARSLPVNRASGPRPVRP